MKTPDKLRQQARELIELAEQMESEQNKPIKEGFLKEDLFEFVGNAYNIILDHSDDYGLITADNISKMHLDFKFDKMHSKGDRFLCYSDTLSEYWIAKDKIQWEFTPQWAEQNLENIKSL